MNSKKKLAVEVLDLIRRGLYSLSRPSTLIFKELIKVILYFDKRISELEYKVDYIERHSHEHSHDDGVIYPED